MRGCKLHATRVVSNVGLQCVYLEALASMLQKTGAQHALVRVTMFAAMALQRQGHQRFILLEGCFDNFSLMNRGIPSYS